MKIISLYYVVKENSPQVQHRVTVETAPGLQCDVDISLGEYCILSMLIDIKNKQKEEKNG